MISVLCPTRGRPEQFADSMDSLYQTALAFGADLKPSCAFEVLALLDRDDASAYQPDDEWRYWFVNYLKAPRYGYANLHRYYNELAAIAKGDYLLLWNDDARMVTRGWNEIVAATLDPTVPAVASFESPDYALFPVVTRAFYEAQGHFSLSPHCDGWVQEVAKAAGCFHYIPGVTVEHLRDELDDETKREGERAQVEQTSDAFFSDEMVALRAADVEKVRAAMAVTA